MKKRQQIKVKRKRRGAPKVARSRHLSSGGKDAKIRLLEQKLTEALEQQTATADVLKVISAVRQAIWSRCSKPSLENATRLCEAKFGDLFRFDGNIFQFAARVGTPAALVDFQRQRGPFRPILGGGMDRMLRAKQVIHTGDHAAEQFRPRRRGLVERDRTVWRANAQRRAI